MGVSFGKGGESNHIICIRLYIVVTSCLSATFRMLLMQLTEQPADLSCFWRTEGVIWIGPTQMPLCHGMTSFHLLCPPLATSNPICLHSTSTPKHTCAAMLCPLLD